MRRRSFFKWLLAVAVGAAQRKKVPELNYYGCYGYPDGSIEWYEYRWDKNGAMTKIK